MEKSRFTFIIEFEGYEKLYKWGKHKNASMAAVLRSAINALRDPPGVVLTQEEAANMRRAFGRYGHEVPIGQQQEEPFPETVGEIGREYDLRRSKQQPKEDAPPHHLQVTWAIDELVAYIRLAEPDDPFLPAKRAELAVLEDEAILLREQGFPVQPAAETPKDAIIKGAAQYKKKHGIKGGL